MAIDTGSITVRQLAEMALADGHHELVKGYLITLSPTGQIHGQIVNNIAGPFWSFMNQHRLGETYSAETCFVLANDPDTVRAPDVAFMNAQHFAGQPEEGFIEGHLIWLWK